MRDGLTRADLVVTVSGEQASAACGRDPRLAAAEAGAGVRRAGVQLEPDQPLVERRDARHVGGMDGVHAQERISGVRCAGGG